MAIKIINPIISEAVGGGEKPLPEKIVYYNNMSGREVAKISPFYGYRTSVDGVTTYIEDRSLIGTGSPWGDHKTTPSSKVITSSHYLAYHWNFLNTVPTNGYVYETELKNAYSITVGGWFDTRDYSSNTGEYQRIISIGSNGSTFRLITKDTTLMMDGTSLGNLPFYENRWCHYALSLVSGKIIVYVNGEQAYEATASETVSLEMVWINHLGMPMVGNMTNIFVSNGALTESEIRQMMFMD